MDDHNRQNEEPLRRGLFLIAAVVLFVLDLVPLLTLLAAGAYHVVSKPLAHAVVDIGLPIASGLAAV